MTTSASSPTPQELRQRFERDGYLVVPDFLDAERLADLNRRIEAHYRPILEKEVELTEKQKANECEVISWDPVGEGDEAFTALRDDPQLAELTAACIGPGFSAPGSLIMYSITGGKGQAWHQDCPCDNPKAFNLNRLIYAHDTNEEDGAIVVVPGSHRMGRISKGGAQEPIEGERAYTPKAGTLILLHGHTYHRVTPNRSGKPRVSINFRAFPAGADSSVTSIGVYRNYAYDFRAGKPIDR